MTPRTRSTPTRWRPWFNTAPGSKAPSCFGGSPAKPTTTKCPMDAAMDDMWVANIPAQPEDTVVQYYIEGASVSGKVQDRPMPAPEGYWQFRVGEVADQWTRGIQAVRWVSTRFPQPASAITCIPVELKTLPLRSAWPARCSRDGWFHAALKGSFQRHVQVLLGCCYPACRRLRSPPGTRGTGHLVATA